MPHSPWSQDLFINAYLFAAHAHHGQEVTGCELPCIAHVTFVTMEVIAALRAEPGRNENLAV